MYAIGAVVFVLGTVVSIALWAHTTSDEADSSHDLAGTGTIVFALAVCFALVFLWMGAMGTFATSRAELEDARAAARADGAADSTTSTR